MAQRLARRIPLTQGKETWVDAADYAAVTATGPWCAAKAPRRNAWYALRNVKIDGRWTTQKLHTFLTGWPMVDHRDRDGLNNCRYNLRPATVSQNDHNQGLARHNTSGFKGVYFHSGKRRWIAAIKVGGKKKTLKSYDAPPPPAPAPRELARAYDAAAVKYFGEEWACTNVDLGLLPPLRKFKHAGHPMGR